MEAESDPATWGIATFTIEVSSASMKVARVTVTAITQGLALGRHVSWKVRVAAAKPSAFWVIYLDGSKCQITSLAGYVAGVGAA
jgi:hypothetical protein